MPAHTLASQGCHMTWEDHTPLTKPPRSLAWPVRTGLGTHEMGHQSCGAEGNTDSRIVGGLGLPCKYRPLVVEWRGAGGTLRACVEKISKLTLLDLDTL